MVPTFPIDQNSQNEQYTDYMHYRTANFNALDNTRTVQCEPYHNGLQNIQSYISLSKNISTSDTLRGGKLHSRSFTFMTCIEKVSWHYISILHNPPADNTSTYGMITYKFRWKINFYFCVLKYIRNCLYMPNALHT